ncbi:MAG: hypothetical protein N3G21_08515 [Candidatus Hydrogenedentes bacterium]|nr:hypothetical protein [Candidatus Hydrogenedentota bacterium]
MSFIFLTSTTLLLTILNNSTEEWLLIPPNNHNSYRGYQIAIESLVKESTELGIEIKVIYDDQVLPNGNLILVGNSETNTLVSRVLKDFHLAIEALSEEEFLINTIYTDKNNKILLVVGGSPIGEAYGVFYLLDKIKIRSTIPEINCKLSPQFLIRQAPGWGKISRGGASIEEINTSFRYGFNWVSGLNVLSLVPWESEPENEENKINREKTKELIQYAHSLGMKYFAFSNEFTYHPSLFESAEGDPPSPCEEEFWKKLQKKYDLLFTALPELDGVEICLDDISGFWGNYRPYDLLHSNSGCKMCYEERYKTFLKKMHEVIVQKHKKVYFHKNWGLREYEIHCQPDIYKKVFTADVPTDNLYVIIKITRGDRWWYQQFNSTFNLTPHKTVMLFEPMNYYEAGDSNIFPTFSAEYFQKGIQYVLAHDNSNLCGISFVGGVRADDWSTLSMYVYALYRLLFEPNGDIFQIAKDYCSQIFGPTNAEDMAKVLMNSPLFYKYGLHIEPISYGRFNSFLHMRVGEFVTEGYPLIDLGRDHLMFLQEVYFKSSPWREATIYQLQYGLNKSNSMLELINSLEQSQTKMKSILEKAKGQMNMTKHLISTNLNYVSTTFSFFDYLNEPTETTKQSLYQSVTKLKNTLEAFKLIPGFNYKVDAIEILLEHSERALKDIAFEKKLLQNIPKRREIEELIAKQQELYQAYFSEHKNNMEKLARIDILVDGQDLLYIRGENLLIKHLKWDPPILQKSEFYMPLPQKKVIVIPIPIASRLLHPFILSHPSPDNNFTATIYIDDREGGYARFVFDLYIWDFDITHTDLIDDWKKYIEKLVKK